MFKKIFNWLFSEEDEKNRELKNQYYRAVVDYVKKSQELFFKENGIKREDLDAGYYNDEYIRLHGIKYENNWTRQQAIK